jgi:hypothetical protein
MSKCYLVAYQLIDRLRDKLWSMLNEPNVVDLALWAPPIGHPNCSGTNLVSRSRNNRPGAVYSALRVIFVVSSSLHQNLSSYDISCKGRPALAANALRSTSGLLVTLSETLLDTSWLKGIMLSASRRAPAAVAACWNTETVLSVLPCVLWSSCRSFEVKESCCILSSR